MNMFAVDTKPHDSITVDYYTYALPTTIAEFIKQVVKPTLLESCEEAIVVEKYLHAIGVIKDDESKKDSKDASRKPQETMIKGRDKQATDIETLTILVKKLTNKMYELKQPKLVTFANSHPPKQR